MTNTKELKTLLYRRGITIEELSEQMGISKPTLSYKINNKREFYAREILTMQRILGISDEVRDSLFFCPEVD